MSKSKNERERSWNERKTNQQPHDKVKSLKELDQERKWFLNNFVKKIKSPVSFTGLQS
jgi:hypothetical protein